MAPSATSTTNGSSAEINIFESYTNTINGKQTTTETTRNGINPATGDFLPPVPVSTPQDVDNAVKVAREAFQTWSKTTKDERRERIIKFADGVSAHRGELAKLLTQEQGKPLNMAQGEIDRACGVLKVIAGLPFEDQVMEETEEKQTVLHYSPLGVAVGIVPWNFPMILACGKIAPAMLAGCTLIIKPSPFTPYCNIKLIEIAQQFFPPGVLQLLSGDDNLGPWLTAHPGIDKISFTGSSATGKKVMESASKTLKRITLELGGNDAAVVCADVDIDDVAAKIADFAFTNSGQVCLAIKRIYIHESIYPQFREALVKHTKNYHVGNGLEDGITHGPIQNRMQYERVTSFYQDIEKEGLKVATGGQVPDIKSQGYFVQPTIIDNPKEDSRLVTEEPFGPIVPILTWSTESDVIARANNTKMGLCASVWTRDKEQSKRIAPQLEAGSVWVNTHMYTNPMIPIGGIKESGIGSEFGISGVRSYCNQKALYLEK